MQMTTIMKLDIKAVEVGLLEHGYSDLQRAEQEGENIYLYDIFLWGDEEDDGKIHYYTSSSENLKIDSTDAYESSREKLMTQYKSKLNTYKHTFKKSENGDYYWVSTEIEK